MIIARDGSTAVYRFAGLSEFPELVHGVFGRSGGVSAPPFDSLNVSHGGGDDAQCVNVNRAIISSWAGGIPLAAVHQVHGRGVHVFNRSDRPAGGPEEPPPEADAAVTGAAGLALLVQVADCQPVLVYDPRRRVVANVHSGWRGSIANVIGRTVAVMTDAFGCRPMDMVAGIGPSLGPCCAEFINYEREIPAPFHAYRCGDHHFDFWAISRAQLTAAGVPDSQIETGGICTRCRPDLFFSYRREHRTGRFGAVIGLKPEAA